MIPNYMKQFREELLSVGKVMQYSSPTVSTDQKFFELIMQEVDVSDLNVLQTLLLSGKAKTGEDILLLYSSPKDSSSSKKSDYSVIEKATGAYDIKLAKVKESKIIETTGLERGVLHPLVPKKESIAHVVMHDARQDFSVEIPLTTTSGIILPYSSLVQMVKYHHGDKLRMVN